MIGVSAAEDGLRRGRAAEVRALLGRLILKGCLLNAEQFVEVAARQQRIASLRTRPHAPAASPSQGLGPLRRTLAGAPPARAPDGDGAAVGGGGAPRHRLGTRRERESRRASAQPRAAPIAPAARCAGALRTAGGGGASDAGGDGSRQRVRFTSTAELGVSRVATHGALALDYQPMDRVRRHLPVTHEIESPGVGLVDHADVRYGFLEQGARLNLGALALVSVRPPASQLRHGSTLQAYLHAIQPVAADVLLQAGRPRLSPGRRSFSGGSGRRSPAWPRARAPPGSRTARLLRGGGAGGARARTAGPAADAWALRREARAADPAVATGAAPKRAPPKGRESCAPGGGAPQPLAPHSCTHPPWMTPWMSDRPADGVASGKAPPALSACASSAAAGDADGGGGGGA